MLSEEFKNFLFALEKSIIGKTTEFMSGLTYKMKDITLK